MIRASHRRWLLLLASARVVVSIGLGLSCLSSSAAVAAEPDGGRPSDPATATSQGPGSKTNVRHDIVPMMLMHCTVCHDGRTQEGGLDLRTRAAMLKGGKSGP